MRQKATSKLILREALSLLGRLRLFVDSLNLLGALCSISTRPWQRVWPRLFELKLCYFDWPLHIHRCVQTHLDWALWALNFLAPQNLMPEWLLTVVFHLMVKPEGSGPPGTFFLQVGIHRPTMLRPREQLRPYESSCSPGLRVDFDPILALMAQIEF